MMKYKNIFIFFIVILFYFQAPLCFAALDLSVLSMDGTNSLRLGRVSPGLDSKKEMRVRIASSGGEQYQVFQRVVDPIVNEKGESLELRAIETVTLSGSNGAGTLYLQNIDRMSFGEQLLYTSGQGGPSDEFQIAYAVRPDLLNTTGNFSGRIMFTARPIGGGAQQQVMVNVFLESSADWKASVEGSLTPGRVRVKGADTTPVQADFVKISFSGNVGQEVKIYQEFDVLPRDQMADEIAPGVLKYSLEGKTPGNLRSTGSNALESSRVLLYTARQPEDEFYVYFLIDPDKMALQKAGLFAGKARYTIESNGRSEVFSIDLECQIDPLFAMDAALPPEGVRFVNVLATDPPVDKEIMIAVRSNLFKDYQVAQNLQSLMANNKGEEISKEFLTFKVEIPAGQKGHTRYADFSPLETGEYPIFSSNGEGAPASFKVIYRLKASSQVSGGDFTAPIRYSLNQN